MLDWLHNIRRIKFDWFICLFHVIPRFFYGDTVDMRVDFILICY